MIDPHDYKRWLRERQRYPLFADDPAIVRPPRSRAEAEARRQAYRNDIRARLRDMQVAAFLRAAHYLKLCRRARIPGAEVWAATATARRAGLDWAYYADTLYRLLRRHGVAIDEPAW